MEKALEAVPSLAVMEAFFFVTWSARYWFMMRRGFTGEPFDDGPWWSVAFFRLWAVCHLPVLLLQTGVLALLKKESIPVSMPFLLLTFLLHAVNFVLLIIVGLGVVTR